MFTYRLPCPISFEAQALDGTWERVAIVAYLGRNKWKAIGKEGGEFTVDGLNLRFPDWTEFDSQISSSGHRLLYTLIFQANDDKGRCCRVPVTTYLGQNKWTAIDGDGYVVVDGRKFRCPDWSGSDDGFEMCARWWDPRWPGFAESH